MANVELSNISKTFGAIETIQASVLTTLMLLIQHPESMAQVRADRSLLAGAVDEAIRWMPPVAFMERWTQEPVTLSGVEIGEREFVGVSVIAAKAPVNGLRLNQSIRVGSAARAATGV